MSPILAGIIGLVALLIFLFMGMHIGLAMSLVGFFGILLMRMQQYPFTMAFSRALGALMSGPFTSCSKESLVVIPMFTLMGVVCYYSGISQDLYSACYKFVSRMRGGLAGKELTDVVLGKIERRSAVVGVDDRRQIALARVVPHLADAGRGVLL